MTYYLSVNKIVISFNTVGKIDMKKTLLVIITLCTLLSLQGCLMELLESSGVADTDEDFIATVSKIHLSINGGEETEYVVYNGGIANNNDSYYKLKSVIDSGTTLSIVFGSSVETGSYGYDSSYDILYTNETTTWIKESTNTFAIEVTQWDSTASFSFTAVLSATGDSSDQVSLNGYVEEVPFYDYDSSTVLHLTVDGEENEFEINGDGVARYSTYSQLFAWRSDINYTFSITFSDDIETGSYGLDALILLDYTENDDWESTTGTAWVEYYEDDFNVEITQWNSGGASFSFNAVLYTLVSDNSTISGYAPGDPVIISGYVENLPFFDADEENEWFYYPPGTVTIDEEKTRWHINWYSEDSYNETVGFLFEDGLSNTTSAYTSFGAMGLTIPEAYAAVGTYSLTYTSSSTTTWGLTYYSSDNSYYYNYSDITLTISQWDDDGVSFSFEGTVSDDSGNSLPVSGIFDSISRSYMDECSKSKGTLY